MQFEIKDRATLKKYLLGDVTPTEQEVIDRWMLSDENADELLLVIEDELIEEALDGELQGSDLGRFYKYFLAAPDRQCKLEFARNLRAYAKSHQTPPAQRTVADWLADFLKRRPRFALATVGSAAA